MKKLALIVAAFVLMGSLSGCAQKSNEVASNEEKISIVTTIFPPYDFVREVAGDLVDVSMLLPPGAESHSFEPSPQDIIKIQNADLFIYNGGDSDHWVDEIIGSMGSDAPRTLKMMDVVSLLEEEVVEGMEDDHDHHHESEEHHDEDADHDHEGEEHHDEDADHSHEGEEHHDEDADHDHDHDHEGHSHEGVMDEHVWTSPKNAAKISEAIAQHLAFLDSANASKYADNFKAYEEKLMALDQKFQAVVDSGSKHTIIFGDRFPLRYFADAYGLEYYAAFVGCSTQSDASAATVAFLIDKVKEENLPVVFHIELSAHKIADAIADATGAEVALFHSCHNLTKDEMDQGASYLSLMTANVDALAKALQ